MSGSKPPQLAAGALGHLLPAHRGVARRPDLAGELGERHRVRVPARRRMAGRQHEVHRVAQQLVALEARRQPPAAGAATRRRARCRRRRARAPAAPARARPRPARSAAAARRAPSASIAGSASRSATDWNAAIRAAAGDGARRRGEVGLGERGALEQRVGVLDQHERRRRSGARRGRRARAARTPVSRSSIASCWETARRRELQRVGDRGDRPALVSSRSSRRRRRSSIV